MPMLTLFPLGSSTQPLPGFRTCREVQRASTQSAMSEFQIHALFPSLDAIHPLNLVRVVTHGGRTPQSGVSHDGMNVFKGECIRLDKSESVVFLSFGARSQGSIAERHLHSIDSRLYFIKLLGLTTNLDPQILPSIGTPTGVRLPYLLSLLALADLLNMTCYTAPLCVHGVTPLFLSSLQGGKDGPCMGLLYFGLPGLRQRSTWLPSWIPWACPSDFCVLLQAAFGHDEPSVDHGLRLPDSTWIREYFPFDEATTNAAICYRIYLKASSLGLMLSVNRDGRGEASDFKAVPEMRSLESFLEEVLVPFLFS
ncbi:hypothetical protein VNO77_14442 [Canavalia gladiata]|uniref:Uncharacterized protein n=1 Tax=Canavalia gladiata TaxID=3824 RepID=A0AAN9M3H7_CANGL